MVEFPRPVAPSSRSLPRRTSRLWAAVALAILSVGLFGPLAHLAVVPHVTCAVDGELAHGDHADHGEGEAHVHEGMHIDAEGSEEQDHGHCQLLLGLPPAPSELVSKVSAAQPRAQEIQLLAPREAPSVDPFPRFLLAPKQSPPERA